MTGSLGSEASTLLAVAYRVVTTGGDVVLLALAAALPLPADQDVPCSVHRRARV